MKKAIKHLNTIKSVKSTMSVVTSSDAVPSPDTNDDRLLQGISRQGVTTSRDPDEIDEASRAFKVWNEPKYTDTKPAPLDLQKSNGDNIENQDIVEVNKTPLRIKVEKGTTFFSDPLRIYPMLSRPRGYALIINNLEFDDPDRFPNRKGAQVDGENLEILFTELGFRVMSYKNMKRKETLRKLIDFSDLTDRNEVDMMIVCILSHGLENGKIVTSDGFKIDTDSDVLRRFNNDYCPKLKGKPKFFIIHACRGEELDYGIFSPEG